MTSSPEASRKAQSRDAEVCVGIFVGGASRRMGRPKGLLLEPEGRAKDDPRRTLVERLRAEAERALDDLGAAGRVVLVGERPEYASVPLPVVRDAALGRGPLGGLVALLEEAARNQGSTVLALACDQPYVTSALLRRVLSEHPEASVVAPRSDGFWQPLCARYAVAACLPRARKALTSERLSLQRLFDELDAKALELDVAERAELQDWDEPGDLPAPPTGDRSR